MSYRIIVVLLACWGCLVAEEADRGRVFDLRLEMVEHQLPRGGSRFLQAIGEQSVPFPTASGRLHVVRRDDGLWVGPEPSDLRQVSFGTPFTVPIVWGDGEAEYRLVIQDRGSSWMTMYGRSVAVAESGDLRMILIDNNCDGVFTTIDDDHLLLTSADTAVQSALRHGQALPLAGVVSWDERPWILDLSAVPRVTMVPYEGPVTRLRLSLPEQMDSLSATVMRDDDPALAGRWRIEAGQTIMVPSGNYALTEVTIVMTTPPAEPEPVSGVSGTWVGRLAGADRSRQPQPKRSWLRSRGGGESVVLEPGDHPLVVGPPFAVHADPVWLHGVLLVTEVGVRGQGGETYRISSRDADAVPEWFLVHGETTQSLGRLEYG